MHDDEEKARRARIARAAIRRLTGADSRPSPEEGADLLRAYVAIAASETRAALLVLAQALGSAQ